MFNLIDFLLGQQTISPLQTPSPKDALVSVLQGASKNILYNPETKRPFPNSMIYSENLPKIQNGQLSEQELQKMIPMIAGMSISSLQPGRAIPVQGMFNKPTAIMAEPRNVGSIIDFIKKLGTK